ncbi:MAG: hypothetical protein OEY93_07340 [Anaerolineae bacterium]|nr:hypothetical protein [Anaerolineae bacterium]
MYVQGNPVNYSDPSGKCAEPVTFFICSIVGGALIGLITAGAHNIYVTQGKGVTDLDKFKANPLEELSKRWNPNDLNFSNHYCDVDWLEAGVYGAFGFVLGGLLGGIFGAIDIASHEIIKEIHETPEPEEAPTEGKRWDWVVRGGLSAPLTLENAYKPLFIYQVILDYLCNMELD